MEEIVKTLKGEREHVLIVRTKEGVFTYRRLALLADDWGVPGPDAGTYDSVETAEREARARVRWLAAVA